MQVIESLPWAYREMGNRALHKRHIVKGPEGVKVKVEAHFDGYAPQSYIRAHVWSQGGWQFVYAAPVEMWMWEGRHPRMMAWMLEEDFIDSPEGEKVEKCFWHVYEVAWQIVG